MKVGVSVIIPTHNDSETLKKAINSALNEKGSVCEVVVVDDCSDEEHEQRVLKIVDGYGYLEKRRTKFGGQSIKLVRNSVCYGLAGARNRGIEEAEYYYIFCLDADDYVYEGGINELFIEALKKEGDIYYGNITDRYPQTDPRHHIAKPTQDITKDDFLVDNPLFCSSLFTKEIWRRAGGYTSRPHSFYEDYDFFAKCFSVGARFRYVPTLVYHHTNDQKPSMLNELHANTNEYKKLSQQGLNYGENKKCYVPKFVDGKYIEI
jgi:glycosyltransferase involved in cell wall biosynthesis